MPDSSSQHLRGPLDGRTIVVGVSAGIAAFKAVHVVRMLSERGANVRVVPTESSLEFVGPATWEALSHNPVATSVFDRVDTVQHVQVGQQADAVVVVPATADLLARARIGRADDLLTATLLVATCPVIMAPAMHTEMWQHPATKDNVRVLRERGTIVLEPATGRLTGSDTGKGRLPEPSAIVESVMAVLERAQRGRDLEGKHIVISAGGTREEIDPVRVLTNRSSGKQGYALAHAALARGARVTLISAPVNLEPPAGAELVSAVSAADMAREVHSHATAADCVIMAAAVSDFTLQRSEAKVKKSRTEDHLTLTLTKTTDILASLVEQRSARGHGPGMIVGFAAETGDSHSTAFEHARAKARRKGADLLAFNDVSVNDFGSESNAVIFLDKAGAVVGEIEGSKMSVAHGLLDQVQAYLRTRDLTPFS